MRVFITGVTGFVGSHIATRLRERGHEVRGSTSQGTTTPELVRHQLGAPIDPAMLAGMDALIHAAHDLRSGMRDRNVAGTIALAEAAEREGVPTQLYVSSYSAHAAAVTEYGLTKRELESWFSDHGFASVRPGLVIGRGGMFERMSAIVRSRRIVPIICPNALVPVIGIADLATAVAQLAESPRRGIVGLHLPAPVTMRALMVAIRCGAGGGARFVPVPYSMALAFASTMERFGIKIPFGSDNVRALHANQGLPTAGELAEFVPSPQGLREMIDAAH